MQPGDVEAGFDAVIVGGGPVGASAAIQLANAGYRVAIVEESTFPYPYPRAVMLDGYSLSILHELLGERANRIETVPTAGAGYYLDKDDLDHPFASPKAAFGEDRQWFFQPELETVLRDAIAANDNIEPLFGWSARKLYRSDRAVLTAQNLSSGETRTLAARYLLGCDGAGSFVRKQMGGSLITLGDTVLFLIVDARVPTDALRGTPGWAYQIVDQERPTTYLPMGVHDHVRWEFRINPDDDILELQSPERILDLLDPFAERERIELVRHTVYKFNSLIASQWRDDNVFVCGDAAHQTSPFLGQGLNMGLRNTRNLCTKLDLVASGAADDRLLDQYQAECFDPTKATIKEALRMGKLLFNTSAPANALRHFVGNTVRRGKPIDITNALMPATVTLGDAGDLPSGLRKALPRVQVELTDTGETPLTAIAQHRPKVLIASQSGTDGAATLDELPAPIRPLRFIATDDPDHQVDGTAMRFIDDDLKAQLFGDDEYIILAENNAVIGRYPKGAEARMATDIRSVFQLV